ncbi:hypothetical protein CKALI_09230 [Corynebacterium kalinowskii]|uniref:TIGR03089 family protein n=1 Tax=Corynebacterium kalinowskii TaxID=2675216 RepID=A0A6B8VS34_9CORY|nr:TIGR03089 family protein [Corynebacterium kalinowskii]QGU02701.1 hypothetical protein CKALI_09230 [Corynebacterium kalinowskii]
MQLLHNLLDTDPAAPRLTFYNESTGSRLDFSAITLDNWAAKVGNMLVEEFDLTTGDAIAIDLPPSWQAAAISLGALAAGIEVHFGDFPADVLFCGLDCAVSSDYADVAIVTEDPFGRGVAEIGAQLPEGAVDFGPTVRFYGDQFLPDTRTLAECLPEDYLTFSPGERVLSPGWTDWESFARTALAPLACGGSAVIVSGPVSTDRLEKISQAERITRRLSS